MIGLVYPYADAATTASLRQAAYSESWLNLLHYEKTWLGNYVGLAAGDGFYLAPNGKRDPEAELKANLVAITALTPLDDSHAICRFPARTRWLIKAFSIGESALPKPICAKYKEFSAKLAARSATLIFSAYYLNNPSSAFGHTLLRLNKAEPGKNSERFELLDFGINFSATVTTDNAFLYGFYGLFGLFQGEFAAIPYYYKVREYNDYDSRDLWEYDLNLNADEISFLVAHLWEVGNTWFRYYYLDKNCSFLLIRVLDAVRPSMHLTEKLPSLYVIPADTIRALQGSEGLIQNIRYRPSPRTLFTQRYEALKPGARLAFTEMMNTNDPAPPALKSLPVSDQVAALDTTLDYFDSVYARRLIEGDHEVQALKHQFLLARAEHVGEPDRFKLSVPETEAPHKGHRSTRFGIAIGSNESEGFLRANFRFALHDLIDPLEGYPSYAEIDFFGVEGRYFSGNKKYELDDLSIVQIVSLAPMSDLQKKISWRVKFGATTLRDDSCFGCIAAQGRIGGGASIALGKAALLYFMGVSEATASGHYARSAVRIGGGPQLGVRWSLRPNLNLLLEAERLFFFAPYDVVAASGKGAVRWAPTERWALDLGVKTYPLHVGGPLGSEVSMGALTYF
jgi:hypothetical protein